jgi:hypothetical protein
MLSAEQDISKRKHSLFGSRELNDHKAGLAFARQEVRKDLQSERLGFYMLIAAQRNT